jgi:hypothetical protein
MEESDSIGGAFASPELGRRCLLRAALCPSAHTQRIRAAEKLSTRQTRDTRVSLHQCSFVAAGVFCKLRSLDAKYSETRETPTNPTHDHRRAAGTPRTMARTRSSSTTAAAAALAVALFAVALVPALAFTPQQLLGRAPPQSQLPAAQLSGGGRPLHDRDWEQTFRGYKKAQAFRPAPQRSSLGRGMFTRSLVISTGVQMG